MGTYVAFTDEQKHRANTVDLVDFLQRHGEELISSGREKRLASDHSITVRGSQWYDHANEIGGHAIDFVKKHYGVSFPDAMTMLLYGEQGQGYRPASQSPKPERKPFTLPTTHTDMRRVYAYLTKTRGIDPEVVRAFEQAKLLYESAEQSKNGQKEYHNAIFVGVDENGEAKHAHKHGLHTIGKVYKGNVDGCNPTQSFHHVGSSDQLYVFEAPIDMLSFISLYPEDWKKHSYVSLCGVGGSAMHWMLEKYPQLQGVSLCLDNDDAGHKASERLANSIDTQKGYTVARLCSAMKDWNDDLCTTMQLEQSTMQLA